MGLHHETWGRGPCARCTSGSTLKSRYFPQAVGFSCATHACASSSLRPSHENFQPSLLAVAGLLEFWASGASMEAASRPHGAW
ncbi:hypothetical protein CSOJ01_10640 [Colletotrichum sojae]|uniref:Uncharacterized protein n=1 Tax=Colletotrichum sojae TaxID=2175907 RepID=A0A8H6IZJ9_9PEZI|nr:hypothetical protein CSOJ01_10640 [Colletotrichum sojae]